MILHGLILNSSFGNLISERCNALIASIRYSLVVLQDGVDRLGHLRLCLRVVGGLERRDELASVFPELGGLWRQHMTKAF